VATQRSILRRSQNSRQAALLGGGWVLPYWLERQANPDSSAYAVGGVDPTNVTGRNWTLIGAVGSNRVGGVDPCGLVVTRPNGWSIDWWIKSEKRWHFPSKEAGVRQRSIDDAPVVETSLRVPGGDIQHSVYAVGGAHESVVLEIENLTPVPVAVAIAIRPYGLTAQASVNRIELDGNTVLVDGEPALVFPRPPGQVVASNLLGGDCVLGLLDGGASVGLDQPIVCQAGLAQAAFSFPLVHSASLSVSAPWAEPARPRVTARLKRQPTESVSNIAGRDTPAEVPSAQRVASGWGIHVDRGARFVMPPGAVASTFEMARRSLALFQRGSGVEAEPLSRPGLNWRDAAPILGALDRMGWHYDVGEVVASIPSRQAASGELVGRRGEIDGTSAALGIIGDHVRLSGVDEIALTLAPTVARAARFIERQRRVKGDRDELSSGLLPARDVGGHLEFRYADNFWALRGLVDAAELLTLAGETDAAKDVAALAADLRVDLLASLEGVAKRFGDDALPATPHRAVDERAIDALVAVWPAGVLKPGHPMMRRTTEVIRERFLHGHGHHNTIGPRGLGTYRTARLGMVELMAGDKRALDRLDWLVGVASPTGAWPRAVHPVIGTGTVGEGHHGVATAHFVHLVRSILVHEPIGDGPALSILAVMPDDWLGQGIEVHEAPTLHGLLSFAIRWHGDRPALLWELVPHEEGDCQVSIRVPGLDATWSTTELRGEALLDSTRPGD